MEKIEPPKAYRLLEPGPILLVTTALKGKANVMTMGFHMMIQHDPPLIGCVIGPWDHSYKALRETGECVLAIPAVDLAKTVVDIGNCSGADTDKFETFKLHTKKAAKVSAPLLPACLANIECRVADDTLVQKYNLFVLEAVAIWMDRDRKERRMLHHQGDGTFTADGRIIDLKARMVRWKELQVAL